MKLLYNFMLLFLGLALFSGSCKKKGEISLFNPPNKLPEATQEGKNTFGFLLNGEVWVPRGKLLDLKLDLSYDPNYMGGTLNIIARRYLADGEYQSITIGSYNINSSGQYVVSKDKVGIHFNDTQICYYRRNDTDIIQSGVLDVTKIDLTKKFISGTFNFKLEKEGCPAINATEGRFDLRIE